MAIPVPKFISSLEIFNMGKNPKYLRAFNSCAFGTMYARQDHKVLQHCVVIVWMFGRVIDVNLILHLMCSLSL